MADRWVVGIYLERSHGLMLMARAIDHVTVNKDERWPTITREIERFDFKWTTKEAFYKAAITMANEIKKMERSEGVPPAGAAIACYGPFESLDDLRRKNTGYGKLNDRSSHLPLRSVDMYKTFRAAFETVGLEEVPIEIHTDANACALGEAVARDLRHDQALVSILVTEGVGAGIVLGRRMWRGALHPELGLLHVRYDPSDPLAPKKPNHLYEKSVADMVANPALIERYELMWHKRRKTDRVDLETLRNTSDAAFWSHQAYYLAQACLACAVIVVPHHIVIASDIHLDGLVANKVMESFKWFMHKRELDDAPVFQYPELMAQDFISSPRPSGKFTHPHPRETGARGMLFRAAKAWHGNRPDVRPLR